MCYMTSLKLKANTSKFKNTSLMILFFSDEVACVTEEECYKHCENKIGCSNIAYPKLVMELMPDGKI